LWNILKGAKPAAAAALDAGSDRIRVAVPRAGKPAVLAGVGESEAVGIAGGRVSDEGAAARSFAEAVAKAEQMSRLKIRKVFLGISTTEAEFLPVRAGTAFKNGRPIRKKDIGALLELAGNADVPAGRQVIQVFGGEFAGPGFFAHRSQSGGKGHHYEWRGKALTVQKSLVEQLTSLLRRLGIEVAEITLSVTAAAGTVLGEAEKQVGTAVVDLGSATTSVAFYKNGILWEAGVLPVGGAHITADLAIGLGCSLAAAEELKRQIGLCGGKKDRDAVFIARARAEEILAMAGELIGRQNVFPRGIVLTGGGALLRGLPELAAEFFEVPVRLGTPRCVFPAGFSPDPAWCASVGLVQQKNEGGLHARF
jgi:cell division protein FtsA